MKEQNKIINKLSELKQQANKTVKINNKKLFLKRLLISFVAFIFFVVIVTTISGKIHQDRLARENAKIGIYLDEIIDLSYHDNKYTIDTQIYRISMFATATVDGKKAHLHNHYDDSAYLKYEIADVKEGDTDHEIIITDGTRNQNKTIKIKRQTKADYDKQQLEKAIAIAEESIKKAESDPTDENITKAESAIRAISNDQQTNYNKRLTVVKNTKQHAAAPATVLAAGLYRVLNTIDGDTIDISYNGKSERVRMIGLDTPETKDPRKPIQCFGREASQRMRDLVAGKNVRIEQDPSQGERDKYGRLLLYIYLEDGTNVAYKMIADGFGHEYTYRIPYKYQSQFKAAQKDAEKNKRGLWADNTCAGDTKKPVAQQSTPPAPAPQRPQSPSRPNHTPAPPEQSTNLPLKAICKDGTVQYQDSPDLPNYRGMCSGHGGISKRLGRVP